MGSQGLLASCPDGSQDTPLHCGHPAPGSGSQPPGLRNAVFPDLQLWRRGSPRSRSEGREAETCSLVQEGQNFKRSQSRSPPGRPAAEREKRLARRLLGEQGRRARGELQGVGVASALWRMGKGQTHPEP